MFSPFCALKKVCVIFKCVKGMLMPLVCFYKLQVLLLCLKHHILRQTPCESPKGSKMQPPASPACYRGKLHSSFQSWPMSQEIIFPLPVLWNTTMKEKEQMERSGQISSHVSGCLCLKQTANVVSMTGVLKDTHRLTHAKH